MIECTGSGSSTSVNTNGTKRRPTSGNNHKSRKEDIKSRSPAAASQTRCSVCASHLNKSPSRQVTVVTQNVSNPAHLEEIKQLRRERDELKCLLDKFERHMSEIQANVKVLTCEKDKYNQMYEEVKEELRATRCELLKYNSKTSNASLATQAVIKRIENERDSAMYELRNALNDRDSFKDRLRVNFKDYFFLFIFDMHLI